MCKSQYLKPGKLKYLSENLDTLYFKEDIELAKEVSDVKHVKKHKKSVKKWKKQHVSCALCIFYSCLLFVLEWFIILNVFD